MIKIKSIEIDGFIVPEQKVKLEFSDSNVICIYGVNGSGKTTLLEILFAILDRDEEKFREFNINKIVLEYFLDNHKIKQQINELKKELNYSTEEEREKLVLAIQDLEEQIVESDTTISLDIDEYNSEYYKFSNSPLNGSALFLGIGRGIHKNELNIPRETLWHFFRANKKISENKILTGNEIDELSEKLSNWLMPKKRSDIRKREAEKVNSFIKKPNIYLPNIEIDTIEQLIINRYNQSVLIAKEKIQNSLFNTLSTIINNSSIDIDINSLTKELIEQKDLIIQALVEIDNFEFKKNIEKILNNLDKDILEGQTILIKTLLFNMVKDIKDEVVVFKRIQTFVTEYNKLLNYNKELAINSNGIFVKPSNHSLQKLSSGERHLLTFMATILLMGEDKEFILIDEPEISLNVDWQREILATLSKLAPNSQIIVATHSPLVVEDYPDSLVKLEIC